VKGTIHRLVDSGVEAAVAWVSAQHPVRVGGEAEEGNAVECVKEARRANLARLAG
jgi:hypothetical protein